MDGSFEPTVSPDSGHLFLDKIKKGKKKKVRENKEISRITHNFAAPVWRVYTYTAICRGICFLVCWALSPLPLWKDLCRLHSAPSQNKILFFFFPPNKTLKPPLPSPTRSLSGFQAALITSNSSLKPLLSYSASFRQWKVNSCRI